jgi:hypothetical protein
LAIALGAAPPGAARADSRKDSGKASEVDTENMFGFTQGSDTSKAGEREIESDSSGAFGRRTGSYNVLASTLEAKYALTDSFRIAPSATVAYYGISGVDGLADRNALVVQGVSLALRYQLLDRERAPLGLCITVAPTWGFVDDGSGAPADRLGSELTIAADRELVANRIYGAFNLIYEAQQTRLHGIDQTERESTLGTSTAVALQVQPGLFLGGEAWYLRRYQGIALESFAGHAFYAGPTLYATIAEKWFVSAAWNIQVAGHATGVPGALDLVNFERHQAKLRVGVSF